MLLDVGSYFLAPCMNTLYQNLYRCVLNTYWLKKAPTTPAIHTFPGYDTIFHLCHTLWTRESKAVRESQRWVQNRDTDNVKAVPCLFKLS